MAKQGHVIKVQEIHHNAMICLRFWLLQEITDQHIAANMIREWDQDGMIYLVDD